MERTAKRVVGIYKSEQEAIVAIEDLKKQGYATRDISIIGRDSREVDIVMEETDTEVVDGITTGALTGGALVEIGLSKEEAEYYGNSVKEGNILVLVDEKEQFGKNREQEPPLSGRIL
ncbi:general stress protein [Priestia megaterium]|uniref:general stress protein n=1 Tax=Priestia megaterium TaxID=1404 RepID=UPI0020794250|nr:general stress protein [Priestia megaterium]USL45668.1 general stress protein [Priestia megaterium]